MTDKITGAFVRLPLSDERKRKVVAEMMFAPTSVADAFSQAALNIGTPVTGGDLDVFDIVDAAYGDPSAKYVRQSDAQAQIAALEAEVVRLRGGLEKAHLSAILGDVDPSADLECCRKHIEEALKGGDA